MSYVKDQLLSDSISIPSKILLKSRNVDGIILHTMKKQYENKCSKNGYVVPDSLEIIQRSTGKLNTVNSQSCIIYQINYKIQSILPCKDDIYECIIDSITRMGMIAYLNYKKNKDSEIKDSPLLIIIPKEYFTEENKITDYSVGDKINIKVLDSRIKYMSTQIQIIGEPLF